MLHRYSIWGLFWRWRFSSTAENCAKRYKSGLAASGVFKIFPGGQMSFDIFCDQPKAGGGWIVFQKRLDGSADFYRNWTDYKRGFGDLSGEFWLGLDKIHRLTSQTNTKLPVELKDFEGNTAYAEYDIFAVADEADNYRLSVAGYTDKHRVWKSLTNVVVLLVDPMWSVYFWPSASAISNAQAVTFANAREGGVGREMADAPVHLTESSAIQDGNSLRHLTQLQWSHWLYLNMYNRTDQRAFSQTINTNLLPT